MPRAIAIARPGSGRIIDTLLLDHHARRAQRGSFTGINGTCVEIDFAEPVRLRTDDLLQLETGDRVEVVAAPETLIELRATDAETLARLAWLLGDHHIPLQVLPRRLRAMRTADVMRLAAGAGVTIAEISAPFEPEGGAYAGAHHHSHGTGTGDDHDHHDH